MRAIRNLTIGLTRLWWIPLLTGLAFTAFGVWCFISPEASIATLAYIFCIGLIAAGVLDIAFAGINRGVNLNWGWSLALGLLEIIAGVWMINLPAPVMVSAFIFAVGIWLIVAAVNAVCEACFLSPFFGGWRVVWMVLLLLATMALAGLFIFNPIMGGVAVWLYLGISLIAFGVYRISLSLGLLAFNRRARRSY